MAAGLGFGVLLEKSGCLDFTDPPSPSGFGRPVPPDSCGSPWSVGIPWGREPREVGPLAEFNAQEMNRGPEGVGAWLGT